MWPFRKKQPRRIESALARADNQTLRWRQFRERGLLFAFVVGLLFVAAVTATIMMGGRLRHYQAGKVITQTYRAAVDFTYNGRHYPSGSELADEGVIDEKELALIQAEQQAYLAAGLAGPLVLHLIAVGTIALLVTGGLGFFLYRFDPDVLASRGRTVALAAIMLLAVMGTRLATQFAGEEAIYVVAVMLVLLAVMTLSVAHNQRMAIIACWLLSLLMVLAIRQYFQFLIVLLAAVTVAGMSLGTIRSRTKLLLVGLATAVAALLATVAVGVLVNEPPAVLLRRGIAVAGASLAAAFVFQGILPLIERAYGVATAMTLLEYSDVSKPLLRRLAAECPGTFNHCLLLGAMAEAAAESVKANGLLARVGAYYHDIGKINKPGYFVENQEGSFSRHAKLSPAMSLLIILGHVKDGVELAREYKLPKVIVPFIIEHHGTTLVEYFYHAAARLAPDADPPAEAQFRYPGPKPQSKETAILMLADAVEGATRSLAEPTPPRIEDVVHQIARRRLDDGQLDDCNLTLRELHTVERSLIKSLLSFYHGRIAYPSQQQQGQAGSKIA